MQNFKKKTPKKHACLPCCYWCKIGVKCHRLAICPNPTIGTSFGNFIWDTTIFCNHIPLSYSISNFKSSLEAEV